LTIGSIIFVPWRMRTSLTFAWQQELAEPNNLAGWKLYQSTTSGRSYKRIDTIPFVASQTEYTAIVTITGRAHQQTTLYFVLTALNTAGGESGYSNERSIGFQPQGVMGYDFIWSGQPYVSINYGRVILQIIGIVIGTAPFCLLASIRRSRGNPF